jgi:hypothetical protein
MTPPARTETVRSRRATFTTSTASRPPALRTTRRVAALGAALGAVVALTLACYEVTAPPPRPLALQLPDTGTADGASLLALAVVIDTATPADKRTVALTTSAGTFATSGAATATAAPDAAGIARTLLRAPADSTSALVTATVNGATASTVVVFRRAMPDAVDVLPAQLTLAAGAGHELTVTATLRRAVGKPSPAIRVTFSAVDTTEAHAARGAFLPVTAMSDANGVATTRFSMPDTSYHGPLVVHATVAPAGTAGEAVIQIVAP